MRKFGLVGYPLGHSFSRSYFSNKFEEEGEVGCVYENYELTDIDELRKVVESEKDLIGLNITIPYKQEVIKLLDEIDADAKEIGAVNTIKITRKEGKVWLKGFNTDVYGFQIPLDSVLKKKENYKALILGTGGASKAVAWVMEKKNIPYAYVSRNPGKQVAFTYDELTKKDIEEHHLIINTTPLGMTPNVEQSPPLDYTALGEDHILYDLIYNPEETRFLNYGIQKKAITINGLPMLYFQADKAWEIWNT